MKQQSFEVRICTHKTCTRQGSRQVAQFGKDLALPGVEVITSGCLGACGNGPNAVVIATRQNSNSTDSVPRLKMLHHINSPSRLAEHLQTICNVVIDDTILKCTELRLAGNAAAIDARFEQAIDLYTHAIELNPIHGIYMIYSNRSAARLASGDMQGALSDALLAVEGCPDSFYNAAIRLADALFALQRYEESLSALRRGGERCATFKTMQTFKDLERHILKKVGAKASKF